MLMRGREFNKSEQESLLFRVLLTIVLVILFVAFLITALSGDVPMMPPRPLKPPGIRLASAAGFPGGSGGSR